MNKYVRTPILQFLNCIGIFLLFVSFFAAPAIQSYGKYTSENVSILAPSILQFLGCLFLFPHVTFQLKKKKPLDIVFFLLLLFFACCHLYFFIAHAQISGTVEYLKWIQNSKNPFFYAKMIGIRGIFFLLLPLGYTLSSYQRKAKNKLLFYSQLILILLLSLTLLLSFLSLIDADAQLLLTSFSRSQSLDVSTYHYYNENFLSLHQLEQAQTMWSTLDSFSNIPTWSCFITITFFVSFICSFAMTLLHSLIILFSNFLLPKSWKSSK